MVYAESATNRPSTTSSPNVSSTIRRGSSRSCYADRLLLLHFQTRVSEIQATSSRGGPEFGDRPPSRGRLPLRMYGSQTCRAAHPVCELPLNQHQHAVTTLEVCRERLDLLATLRAKQVGNGKEVAVLAEPLGHSLRLGCWCVAHHDGMHARPKLIRRAADDLDRIVGGKLE